ncbi:DUF4192 domain-containing protein [Nocardia sp. NPDC052566]|uniref:DUF4192 domain-containing protein n=1 Tax=Nocardia sp. NPDC052566 TaxID=3364330 RepID=UPI0037C86768
MTTPTNPHLAVDDPGAAAAAPCAGGIGRAGVHDPHPGARTGSADPPWGGALCRERPPKYGDRTPPPALHVDDPGELIAAIPAMLGFAPERSLVVLMLRPVPDPVDKSIIEAIMRFDLDTDGGPINGGAVVPHIAHLCAGLAAGKVLAVIVDDRLSEPPPRRGRARMRSATKPFTGLITTLALQLSDRGLVFGGVWAVPGFGAGLPWWSVSGLDRHGRVPDPATSMVAMAHLLDGRPIHASRGELAALVAPDPVLAAEVAAQLDSAVAVARDRYASAVRRGDPAGYSRTAIEQVLWQIANTESGAELDAPEIAELIAALRDRPVRDAMFALALSEHALAAEGLWLALARAGSGSDRAEAAALLGYSAYARGDGPFAGMALTAALAADPAHPMAVLLETALYMGLRPDRLRSLARCGFDTAGLLGIDLGLERP